MSESHSELVEQVNDFLVKCDALDYTQFHALEKAATTTRDQIAQLEEAISDDEVDQANVAAILASARKLIAQARRAAEESDDEDIPDAATELEVILDRIEEEEA